MLIKGLSGLSKASIAKYPCIIPLYCLVGTAVGLGTALGIRTLIKNPEVSVARKRNPEPWNAYRHKQYKLFSVAKIDYDHLDNLVPVF